MFNRRLSGQKAEKSAQAFLRKQGLKDVDKNYLCRQGEIDLIMLDGDVLVFIEVRMRNNTAFGMAAETVDRKKQTKIIRSAQHFLQQQHQFNQHPMRFDIVAIENGELNWIQNAFQTD